ncbi:MAG: hypothetical protein Q9224_006763, partial [Gallowayella concinna]
WTLKDGLQRATVNVNGNIVAGLSLGIDAEVQVHQTFDYPIAAVGIPGFSVPNIIIVGPSLSLTAIAELNITLAGQVLTGVEIEIANFEATVDFINGNQSRSANFLPRTTPIFNATAQFSAAFALGLPLSLGVGVEIPPIKFKKTASINEAPSFEASMNYTASTTDVGVNGDTDCVNGIGYNVGFVNTIFANLFGLYKYNLNTIKRPLTTGCKRFGAQAGKRNLIGSHPYNQPSHLRRRQAPEEEEQQPDGQAIEGEQPEGVDGPEPFDYVESLATNATSANDTLFRISNATSFSALDNAEKTTNGSLVPFAPDTEFLNITDLSGNNALVADEDGNIYYASPGNGSQFASVSGIVEGDAAGRFFHYYNDTMAAYNVSRLRLSDEAHIPLTADFLGFAPVNHDDDATTPDVFVAMDTIGGVFFPVTCDIQGQSSKAFLVRDIAQGVRQLQEPSLRYTVTGGVVETCYFLPWAAPRGSADAIPPTPANPEREYPLATSG